MTYLDLTKRAVAAVCENPSASFGLEDYQTRASFLLATFIGEYKVLDGCYREALGMEAKEIMTDMASVDLEDDFPLCDVFIPAAIHCLAAGLVIDENEDMSDKFFDRYITGVMDIRKSLPAKQAPIIDRYGLE